MHTRHLRRKVVFLGDSGVGKTSIIQRYDEREWNAQLSTTMGACFIISTVVVDKNEVQMHIWDTAGQERYRSMVPLYLRNADVVVIVFDLSNFDSFSAIETWAESTLLSNWPNSAAVASWADAAKPPTVVVVGNKTDLSQKDKAIQKEVDEMIRFVKAKQYFETSAFKNEGITEMFEQIARQIVADAPPPKTPTKSTVELENASAKKTSCC